MSTVVSYSQASRCPTCNRRAVLDKGTAEALVAASSGSLECYECPHLDGWHVWSPHLAMANEEPDDY